jgi:lysophospholipase L1-like esterase
MTRRKFAAFATITVVGSVVLSVSALLAADLYAHRRVERSVGVNRQGFRGPVVGRKQPGETRIVMLGGSTVFGYDVEWDDTIAAALERRLRERHPNTRVINLGFIAEGSLAFVPTLESYEYLDYDIVCLYEGYNDVLGDAEPNRVMLRHGSPVFRLTGYFPVLPLVLREKAGTLMHGSVAAAYQGGSAPLKVFRPGLANRAAAAAMETTATVAETLDSQLGRFSEKDMSRPHEGTGCAAPWETYCRNVAAAVRFARARQASVVVVSQPRMLGELKERHAWQQRALSAMLAHDFAGDPEVRYVDASGAVDLSSQAVTFDGLHLNRDGNMRVAETLLEPVAKFVK